MHPSVFILVQRLNESGLYGLGKRNINFCLYFNAIVFIQNENVRRAATSECFIKDMRRPDRWTPFIVLVKKSYKFVDDIWNLFVQRNCRDIRYVFYTVS